MNSYFLRRCDGPARKLTLAVDLLLYLQLPLRMVHGKTKEKKNKTKRKRKQNKTTGATNKAGITRTHNVTQVSVVRISI